MDNLTWLAQWYLGECNSDWEHTYGVKIETLDNPGWILKIDLRETDISGRTFCRVDHGEPASSLEELQQTGSWWVADVKDEIFEAACGPLDLPAVIQLFRDWVEESAWSPSPEAG